LPAVKSIAIKIRHLDFLSDKATEFIDLNQRADRHLGLFYRQMPSSPDKPTGNCFVMNPNNLANGSDLNPSKYGFRQFFESEIFATTRSLKCSSASSVAVGW
tara:strand:+ start:72 stop:377 length:306 start_codon:yes stop_codon:yes gene_type:complete